MLDWTCKKFINILASKEPVPGGGGACALVASLGVALGCMVSNLTIGKKKYQNVEDDLKENLRKSENTMGILNNLVMEDAKAFYPLVKAYGLPENTIEDKQEKEAVMQQALKTACEVPLEIARHCAQGILLQEELAHKGSAMAISDVGVGVAFLEAALKGAKLNVLINTKLMKDESLKRQIESEITAIEREYGKRAQEIYASIEKALADGGSR